MRAAASQPSRAQVEDVLASVGFDAVLRGSPVASLSGGWKMKLALGAPHVPVLRSVYFAA